jgi:hypothetical protein
LYVDTFDGDAGSLTTLNVRVDGFNPQGQVIFFGPNNTLLGTATVVNGGAILALSNSNVQPADVRAVYAGDANNAMSIAQRIESIPNKPTLSYTIYQYAQDEGRFNVIATVSGAGVGGTVMLLDEQGRILQSGMLDTGTTVNLLIENQVFTAGQHNLTLLYSGNASAAPAVATVPIVVDPVGTSTSLSVDSFEARVGQTVVYTATVTGASNPASIGGQVQFKDEATGVVLGTAPVVNGVAVLSTQITEAMQGDGYVSAEYQGDSYYASSAGWMYRYNEPASSTALPVATLSTSETTVEQGAPLTLTVSLASSDGWIDPSLLDATVYFYDGGVLLGSARTDYTGVATLTTSLATVGTARITAVAARMIWGSYPSNDLDEQVISTVDVGVTASIMPPPASVDERSTSTTTLAFYSNYTGIGSSTAFGTPITLTAVVSGGYIPYYTPVAFYNHGQLIGVGRSEGNSASLNLDNWPPGNYAFTAVFGGVDDLSPSESEPSTLTVETVPTTTQLQVDPAPDGARNEYRLLAQVIGTPLPQGKVNFYNGNQLLGQADLRDGIAILDRVVLSGGAASIYAEYAGDATSGASESAAVVCAVYDSATQVVLSSSAASATIGAPLVLRAEVLGGDPHGVVSFFDGDTLLGSANLYGGAATLTVANLPLGNRSLRAVYAGDANSAPATSNDLVQTVKRGAGLVLTADRTNSIGSAPVMLTATFGNAGAGGSVRFMDGDIVLGTADIVDGQAVLTSLVQTSGLHTLHAVYDGDAAEPASSSMSVELDVQAEPTSVSIFSQVSSTNYGDPLTLTARVTGSNSTGTVTFLSSNGYLVLGSAPVIDGVATLTLADPLDAGSYQFVASYSGDALHAGSASATIMQTVVVAAPPSLTLRSQVGALPVGAILVLTAQLTLNGQGVRSGVVEFFDGNTYLGSAYVQPDGIAQLSVSTLAAGTHAIRAAYRNNSYQTSEALSPVIVEVTNIVGPTLSVTPSGWISIGQGQTTTLRAILSGGASPTGVVTFSANVGFGSLPSDHKVLGTATVVDGVATLEIDASDIGNDYLSVGVSYSGDANNSGTSLNNAVSISPT